MSETWRTIIPASEPSAAIESAGWDVDSSIPQTCCLQFGSDSVPVSDKAIDRPSDQFDVLPTVPVRTV